MFRLEKPDGALLLLLEREQVLLQLGPVLENEACFRVDIDGADLVPVGIELQERTVHLCLDFGQLLFQEFERLLCFGVPLFHVLPQVGRGDFVQDGGRAVRVDILVAEFQDAGFLAFFLDGEGSLERTDGIQAIFLGDGELLARLDFHRIDAEGDGVARVGSPVGLPGSSRQDLLSIVVEKVEGHAVLCHGEPGLAHFFGGELAPGDFELVHFHPAFTVEQPVELVQRFRVILQVHLLDGFADNLAAHDELDFRLCWAGCREKAPESGHHSHVLVVFRLDL